MKGRQNPLNDPNHNMEVLLEWSSAVQRNVIDPIQLTARRRRRRQSARDKKMSQGIDEDEDEDEDEEDGDEDGGGLFFADLASKDKWRWVLAIVRRAAVMYVVGRRSRSIQ